MVNTKLNKNSVNLNTKASIVLSSIIVVLGVVIFAIGSISAPYLWKVQVVGVDWLPQINWTICGPYLAILFVQLTIVSIKMGITRKFRKYNKDNFLLKVTYPLLICEIVSVILSICSVPMLMIPVDYDTRVFIMSIIFSSFTLGFSIPILIFDLKNKI